MSREMRHSGIEWIGKIPKEWEVCRIKDAISSGKEGIKIGPFGSALTNRVTDNAPYKIYGQWNIVGKDFSAGKNYISEDTYNELTSYQVIPGDILISMMGTIGKCAIIPKKIQEGIMDSHVIKIRIDTSKIYSKFFEYIYDKDNSSFVFDQLNQKKKGSIMDGLNSSIVKNLVIMLPPLSEQQKITDYLDNVCGEVDEMIALQEQMIEELKAYKQSVITEAVTKGLNTDVPMKDSGIEWIGEVPEHWEVRKIGNLFRLRDEKNYKPMDEVQLLSLYTGIGVFPHGEQEERGNKAITVEGYKVVHKDDIVVNIILAWMGAIGVSNYNGVTSPAYDVYIPDMSKVVPHFFHYVFRTQGIAGECYKYGRGIMMMRWRTYSSEFKQIRVPFPSLEEQQSIASFLDEKCSEIDSLVEIKQAKIEELKEYKKSIIYEYVTGKKDVPYGD